MDGTSPRQADAFDLLRLIAAKGRTREESSQPGPPAQAGPASEPGPPLRSLAGPPTAGRRSDCDGTGDAAAAEAAYA
jgi:hypothetical protein